MNLTRLIAALLAAALASCSPPAGSTSSASPATDFATELAKPGLFLVDFTATWCGPCRTMKPIVEKASKDYPGKIRIIAVDIDQQPEIAQRYNVQSIPNFVFLKDGKVLDSRLGSMPETAFRNWLDGFVAAAN